MAWEDRTPFDAIEAQFGLAESEGHPAICGNNEILVHLKCGVQGCRPGKPTKKKKKKVFFFPREMDRLSRECSEELL